MTGRNTCGEPMDYADMLRDAWTYTRQGVLESGSRWVRMILAIVLLAIPMNGYMMRIYRGAAPAPDVDQWGQLCIDGLKLIVISCIYSIPIWLLWLATYWTMMAAILSGNADAIAATGNPNWALMVLMYIVEFIIALLLPIVAVRFARGSGFFGAFNLRAVLDRIASIGWLNYVLGIIIVTVVVAIPVMVMVFIFVLLGIVIAAIAGFSAAAVIGAIALAVIILLIVMPVFMVFQARFWTQLYDGAAAPPV